MKPPHHSSKENAATEPPGLRVLRITTLIMTLVMIVGFILIVSLLSIAINKNVNSSNSTVVDPKFKLSDNEVLHSISYLPAYTILIISKDPNKPFIRLISNKTGKTVTNVLVSELVK